MRHNSEIMLLDLENEPLCLSKALIEIKKFTVKTTQAVKKMRIPSSKNELL